MAQANGNPQSFLTKTQLTPTMAKVISDAIDKKLWEIHTAMPGEIVSYDVTTGLAEVQPLLTRTVLETGAIEPYPILADVPVQFMGPINGWLHFPLNAHDPCLLLFSERSLENWFAQGGQQQVTSGRVMDLTDAICIPGLRSSQQAIELNGAASSLELAFGDAWIEITNTGKFKVQNGSQSLKNILNDINSMIANCTSSPTGGPLIFTTPNPPQISGEITDLFA